MTRLCGTIKSAKKAAAIGVSAAMLGAAAPPASADVFTRHNLTFVHVGDPGNRGATAQEAPLWPAWAPPLGAVDHDFGIMRTNVTNEQWVEFVRAYGPHWTGSPGAFALTGPEIFYTGTVGGVPQYAIGQGADRHSAQASWRVMARYCNWLHNNKSSDPGAFENGAYDTSTFGEVVVGGITMLTDQFTHHPDARFWIPTVNEYTKAAHWDPDRYGPGQGGYWTMPDGGDERLVAGPPGVGEAAGDWWQIEWGYPDVELYPDTQSPWGLLDVSSTVHQFTEGVMHPTVGVARMDRGSIAGSSFYWLADGIDYYGQLSTSTIPNSVRGMRIATAIPSPASVAVLVVGVSVMNRRFRHGKAEESVGRGAARCPGDE